MLEGRGHIVTLTRDGSECLTVYRYAMDALVDTSEDSLAQNPPFDVVLLDYFMPNMDGLQAAKLILGANKHQRIIFVSAFVKSTLEESIKQLPGMVELVEKPIDLDVLTSIIEDKRVYQEFRKKKQETARKIKDPGIEQLRNLLQGPKNTHYDTHPLS